MPEQEVNSAAAKFISSLVKSLQILCNGQVDFAESIELVGHINVRVDHKYKFDYIVDEQVSKEGEDSSTTFLSNSYHSCPPVKQYSKKFSPNMDQDVMFAELPQNALSTSRQTSDLIESRSQSQEFAEEASLGDVDSNPNYSVTVESSSGGVSQANQMVVKLEGGDDSNDCMVLPASPESHGSQSHGRVRKRRQPIDQGPDDSNDSKGDERRGKSVAGKRGASELIGKFAAYECSYCSVILTESEDLSVHSKNCPSPSCSMICLTCGEKFPSKPEMRQHLKFVHGHKTFGCKFCDMMFLSSSGLLSHTKAKHRPDPKTLCQICGQAFHNRANLEGHMNMHLGLKPFKCKKCGKSYGHSKSLITHEKNCTRSLSSKVKSAPSSQQQQVGSKLLASKNVNIASINEGSPSVPEKRPTELKRSERNIETSDEAFPFRESYTSFGSSRKMGNEGSSLQSAESAEPHFTYSGSYQSLQSVDMVSMQNSSMGGTPSDNVYPQTNTDFVLPHVDYGIFPSGMIPDHR